MINQYPYYSCTSCRYFLPLGHGPVCNALHEITHLSADNWETPNNCHDFPSKYDVPEWHTCTTCIYFAELREGVICNAFYEIANLSEKALAAPNNCPDYAFQDKTTS